MGISVGEKGGWNWLGLRSGLGPAFGTSVPSIDPSLIAWWSPSLDPSPGGSVLTDLSGNGFDGQIVGANWVNDAASGGVLALSFDGINDIVDFGDVLDVGNQSFSVSVWFKAAANLTSAGTGARLIQKRGTGAANSAAGWTVNLSRFESRLFIARGNRSYLDTGSVFVSASGQTDLGDLEAWLHLVFAVDRDSETMNHHIDGQILNSTSIGAVGNGSLSNNRHLTIGASENTPTQYFSGCVDDVRIYDRILEPSEIINLGTSRAIR